VNLKDKNILVTGADGFIGSHLVEELVNIGCNVKAFTYYNSTNSWGWLDSLTKEVLDSITVCSGDIRDKGCIDDALADVDVVFHLAALIGIPYSYIAPESYIDTNITGTLNVLQSARKSKTLDKIIITSTSEVYGTAKYVPIDELHPKQGQSPYSASKIGADYLAESYYRSFDLPITIARPFNTYGPRQSLRAIIPTIINQLLSGKENIELGSLTPTRDFLYVKDTANAFVEIAKTDLLIGHEVNIATGQEISIAKLANELIAQINPNAVIETNINRLRPKNSEVERLCGCNKKLLDLSDWKPTYSFKDGLKETVNWFKSSDITNDKKASLYTV
jgi:dTDP-glucose 4,6-dehydratase